MASDNNYLKSAASTRNVGRNVAMVINHMVSKRGAKMQNIHVIGHSLGSIGEKLTAILLKENILFRCTLSWICWNVF